MDILDSRELDIIRSRHSGESFYSIGNRYGVRYSRIQAIYKNSLYKLKLAKDLKEHNPELLRAAKKRGWSFKELRTLTTILKNGGCYNRWKRMSKYELSKIPQIGKKYLDFLTEAKADYPW